MRNLLLLLAVVLAPFAAAEDLCSNKELETTTPPVAIADAAFAKAGGVVIPVLANDIVGAGGSLAITGIGAPARGGTAALEGTSIRYTPPATLVDDQFEYTITDTTQPGTSSTAIVTIHVAATVSIQHTCVDGNCTFTAVPTITEGIRSYLWWWGDTTSGQPKTLIQKVNHTYGASGNYTVRVDVLYWAGNTVTTTKSVPVTYRQTATWDEPQPFPTLVAAISNIRGITTFPAGTIVKVNWSPNAADCKQYCGPITNDDMYFDPSAGSCPTTCYVSQIRGYEAPGTYVATLRFRPPAPAAPTDYPIHVTVRNATPSAVFTFGERTHDWAYNPYPPRTIQFDGQGAVDDGPYPLTYEWDFGDGTTQTDDELYDPWAGTPFDYRHPPGLTSLIPMIVHSFPRAGTYNVTLRLRDASGEVGIRTQQVEVINRPPVAKITANCRLQQCTFTADASTDEEPIAAWEWNVGDGRPLLTAKSITVSYAAAGCYVVSLKVTDVDGAASSTARLTVPVGPPVATQFGGVVVDAHVQTATWWNNGVQQWRTSNGNLNGILEPGESVVVEPRWTANPSTVPVTVASPFIGTGDNGIRPELLGAPATYDRSAGVSDCWTGGNCWFLKTDFFSRYTATAHDDLQLQETFGFGGAPTPGSPVSIHVGASFTDIPVNHWAYSFVESALHAGIIERCDVYGGPDYGWGAPQFCPTTLLTRAAIAPWLLKAKYGGSYNPPACSGSGPFTDVTCSHPQAAWIAQLKADGITKGTADGRYLPDANVTRAEIAAFLLRAKMGGSYVPPPCSPDFTDVACPSPWADWISELKRRGVTAGCTTTTYCPDSPLDRAQAATFFVRNFERSIVAPGCPAGTPIHQQPLSAMSEEQQ